MGAVASRFDTTTAALGTSRRYGVATLLTSASVGDVHVGVDVEAKGWSGVDSQWSWEGATSRQQSFRPHLVDFSLFYLYHHNTQ